ncbi:MAG: ATP-binding cassette domain-containing protein [Candidatus Bathyarchaeia archaeon]
MNAAVEASDLTKSYGETLAVNHLTFRVEGGEFFGFLGPNGAGKTTTIRILTCVVKPDHGSASVMGYNILREPLRAKQVMGILPEMSNAYVDLTAWQNMMFMGELYGVPAESRRRRAETLLRKFGIYDRRDQPVKGFSKGMKQRLLICMALINEPEILFLDEPTGGLDVQSARLIRSMLFELNQDGTTIFLTTHNMDEADQLCDRVAIIDKGRIIALDRPERLRSLSRKLQSIEVAFDKSIDIKSMIKIGGVVEVKEIGDKIRLYTEDPDSLLRRLVEYAQTNGLKFVDLKFLTPSLEDVFVAMTGPKVE